MATSTSVGQNIGASKFDRAKKTAKRSAQMSFIGLTLISFLLFFTSPYLAELLLPNEPATTAMATVFLQIVCLGVPFIGIQLSLAGAVNGAGKTNWSMLVGILFLWAVQIPLAYFLAHHTALAETGFWISFPIANILSALAMFFVIRKINWEKSNIHHA